MHIIAPLKNAKLAAKAALSDDGQSDNWIKG
jgi:hypothetical protein